MAKKSSVNYVKLGAGAAIALGSFFVLRQVLSANRKVTPPKLAGAK